MSLRALGEEEGFLPLRRAYELNPGQPDVGREYAAQCMRLGMAEEGVRITREVHARRYQDAGLQANLALALLIAGEVGEAWWARPRWRATRPTRPLAAWSSCIGKVKAGQVPCPTMPGM